MVKCMAALFIPLLMCFMISFKKKTASLQKPGLHTIIVDAGHGGPFHGTKGLFSKEEDVTLDIALKLGEAIKKEFPDIKVVYTRTVAGAANNATTLRDDLHSRAQIANQAKGDL